MKKKIVALTLIVVLALTATIGGTLAYFTDAKQVSNTFAVGNVGLDVWEHRDGETTREGFDYENMMPGVAYEKDAWVKMNDDSQPAYLYVELAFSNASNLWTAISNTYPDAENPTGDLVNLMLVNPHAYLTNDRIVAWKHENNTYSVVYKFDVQSAGTTINLFDAIQIPAEMDNTNATLLNGTALTVKAHAIQEAGLTPDAARQALLIDNGYKKIEEHPNLPKA